MSFGKAALTVLLWEAALVCKKEIPYIANSSRHITDLGLLSHTGHQISCPG